jgi:hypothetical protein
MPATTVLVLAGSWLVLAALTAVAFLFNRPRGDD